MRFALVGNPNVGKSLIFNQLTGLGVEVSNYPGTTVALHRGSTCVDRERVEILDLPGLYSIDGDQEEEALARRLLTEGGLNGAIMVLNATNLERNLYLLLQVAETGIPLVVVVNMMDEAEASGLLVDLGKLSGILGVEVLGTAATSGRNLGGSCPLPSRERARRAWRCRTMQMSRRRYGPWRRPSGPRALQPSGRSMTSVQTRISLRRQGISPGR